ncbi:MAG: alpha/beta hydrolase [Candidatus Dormiibacterota bacterium]
MEERRVDCGTLTLSVRDHPGGDPAILALHGLASNARWWDLVAARLSPRWRVLAPDLRGHGRSDRPDTGYSLPEVVDDLRGLLDAEGLDRVVVAGHSWGASVALWLASTAPERVIGCVCVDGGAVFLRDHFPTWAEAEQRLRPPQLAGITEATLGEWVRGGRFGDGDPAQLTEIVLGNFEAAEDGTLRPRLRLERHMEIARRLYELDSFELMTRVRCPVLFLPARGGMWPAAAKEGALRRAQEVLGGRAQVVWLDGEHDLPVERPAEVAAAMAQFVMALP